MICIPIHLHLLHEACVLGELQSKEVRLTVLKLHVKRVLCLLTPEWPRVHSQLKQALPTVTVYGVRKSFKLYLDVALPLLVIFFFLTQDVHLDKMFIPIKEPQLLKQAAPSFLSLRHFQHFHFSRYICLYFIIF